MHMVIIIFYIFAFLSILGSILVISSRNPVKAVLSKVFTFFSVAIIWLIAQHEYLALLLIVIYVGAVLVMFLFVVMMLDINIISKQKKWVRYWPIITFLCIIFISVLSFSFFSTFKLEPMKYYLGSTRILGKSMFSDEYLYIFELAGIILLTSMIASIVLTARGKRKDNKSIDPNKQIRVTPEDR